MNIIYSHVCGMDVHKNAITACALTPKGKELRTFGTFTGNLLDLADWITAEDCIHVAMESTGIFWKPIYNILENYGRSWWSTPNTSRMFLGTRRIPMTHPASPICSSMASLKGSFIQNHEQRELKELVSYRKSLVEERAREVNRIQKVIEGTGIKLASAASDVAGVSGSSILKGRGADAPF